MSKNLAETVHFQFKEELSGCEKQQNRYHMLLYVAEEAQLV